jgi:hypothetical protein
MKIRIFGKEHDLTIVKAKYIVDDSLAIAALDELGERFQISTNIAGVVLEADEFCVKTWSEGEWTLALLVKMDLFKDTGRRVKTGFVEAPIWRLVRDVPEVEFH